METKDKLTDMNTLYQAYKSSLTRRSYKISSMSFSMNVFSNLKKLQQELESKTYKVSGYTEFQVTTPKVRNIKACKFRDKIVQHVLCDNILKDYLPKICIRDNYAGQNGKGTKDARDRLKRKLFAFAFSSDGKGYIYKGDISKYYYNINHDIAKDIMEYHFPKDIHWLIDEFIDSTDGNVGVALGNQINTIVSNLYLDGFDKFIKGDLGIRYYGRYADDFYLIHENKEYLKYCVSCIEQFLCTLDLKLNPKSQIFPLKNGISFLGFHFYVKNNQVVIKLDNGKKRAYRRKFNKLYRKVLKGSLSADKLQKSYQSWKEHTRYCTDKRILNYYERKMEELK